MLIKTMLRNADTGEEILISLTETQRDALVKAANAIGQAAGELNDVLPGPLRIGVLLAAVAGHIIEEVVVHEGRDNDHVNRLVDALAEGMHHGFDMVYERATNAARNLEKITAPGEGPTLN